MQLILNSATTLCYSECLLRNKRNYNSFYISSSSSWSTLLEICYEIPGIADVIYDFVVVANMWMRTKSLRRVSALCSSVTSPIRSVST